MRFTGRCRTCKSVTSVNVAVQKDFHGRRSVDLATGARESVHHSNSLGLHFGATCLCTSLITFIGVRGRVTAHKCGAKCLASKGFVCDCSCGGKNHGAGFAG